MEVKVNIKGVGETINKIQAFNDIAYNELGQKMFEVINDFISDAKYFAPVDTGYLRDHITGRVISKIRGVVIIGRVRSSARYSIFQEFGTIRNRAHPFMIPAFNKNKLKMRDKFKRAMETAIQKAAVGKYYGGGAMTKQGPSGVTETTL
jgi:HK97 gp10 family phage protein